MLKIPQNWQPLGMTIITGLLGLAIWQMLTLERPESTERRIFLEMRGENANEAARQLARWADATSQLKTLCVPDAAPAAPMTEKSSASLAAEERRNAREALEAEFGALVLYFGREVLAAKNEFVEWERPSRGDDCRKLPALAEVRKSSEKLLQALRAELIPVEFRMR